MDMQEATPVLDLDRPASAAFGLTVAQAGVLLALAVPLGLVVWVLSLLGASASLTMWVVVVAGAILVGCVALARTPWAGENLLRLAGRALVWWRRPRIHAASVAPRPASRLVARLAPVLGVFPPPAPAPALARSFTVTGLDLALRSDSEQHGIAAAWGRLAASLPFPFSVHVIPARIDLDARCRLASLAKGLVASQRLRLLENLDGHVVRSAVVTVRADSEAELDLAEAMLGSALSGINLNATRCQPPALDGELVDDRKVASLDGKLHRVMILTRWPRHVAPASLQPLLLAAGPTAVVTLHLHPVDPLLAQSVAERAVARHTETRRSGSWSAGAEVTTADLQAAASALASGATSLHRLGLYVGVAAADRAELEKETLTLRRAAQASGLAVDVAMFSQAPAVRSLLGPDDHLRRVKSLTTQTLACLFPFATGAFVGQPGTGAFYGTNAATGAPVFVDRFGLDANHSSLVFGSSGKGKSFSTKSLISAEAEVGTEIVVVDPEGEYRGIAADLGGRVFTPDNLPARLFDGVTVIDLSGVGNTKLPAWAGTVLSAVWAELEADRTPRRRLIVLDEAFLALVLSTDAAEAVWNLVKRSRKRGAGLHLVTQDTDDVLSGPLGAAILQNTTIKVLLGQEPNAKESTVKAFGLSAGEWEHLATAQRGTGLLIAGAERCRLFVPAFEASVLRSGL